MLLLLKLSTGIFGLYIFTYYYYALYLPWTMKLPNPILQIFLNLLPIFIIALPFAGSGAAALIIAGDEDISYIAFLQEWWSGLIGFYFDT